MNSAQGMNSAGGINSAGSGSGPKAAIEINQIADVDSSSVESDQSKDDGFDFSGGFSRPDTPSFLPSTKDLNN